VKITEEARKKAETVEPDVRDAAAREAERVRLLRMNRARQEANEMRLRARAAVADAVLARVEERLPLLLGETRYRAVAERLYREILPEFPEGNVILRADGATRAALARSDSEARIRFEPLPETEIGGWRRRTKTHVPRSEHAPVPVRESPARVDGRTMEEAAPAR